MWANVVHWYGIGTGQMNKSFRDNFALFIVTDLPSRARESKMVVGGTLPES
jgi:hypothetical protein